MSVGGPTCSCVGHAPGPPRGVGRVGLCVVPDNPNPAKEEDGIRLVPGLIRGKLKGSETWDGKAAPAN